MRGILFHLFLAFFGYQDHPRSCGEYHIVTSMSTRKVGSSPLMRGILNRNRMCCPSGRIIPAHAGNTLKTFGESKVVKDHPRSCGEYSKREPFPSHGRGSSPLMRGIHEITDEKLTKIRIIPAHAGNTQDLGFLIFGC